MSVSEWMNIIENEGNKRKGSEERGEKTLIGCWPAAVAFAKVENSGDDGRKSRIK